MLCLLELRGHERLLVRTDLGGARENAATGAVGWLARRWGLKFPGLFLLFALLFGIDLVVPDLVHFADEAGLALLTLLFGLWRSRRQGKRETGPG